MTYHARPQPDNGSETPRKLRDAVPTNCKRAAKAVGLCAFVDDPDLWDRLDIILSRELRPEACANLAIAAIRSLPPHARAAFLSELTGEGLTDE